MLHLAGEFLAVVFANKAFHQRLGRKVLATVMLTGLLTGVQHGEAAPESIILVNTASDVFDVADRNCETVSIADLPGAGGTVSLREAICASNNTAAGAPHTINFSIGSGVQTISPSTDLPYITRPVTINGASQPGYAGSPLIVLDGIYSVSTGLHLYAGSSMIRGLVIQRFSSGIVLYDNGGNTIQGNYIGTDPTGNLSRSNSIGIRIDWNSPDNLIGGATPGQGNLISGNGYNGVQVDGNNTRLIGNKIGTNAAGTAALGNYANGIEVSGTGTIIGGPAAGDGNLISGNRFFGIWVSRSDKNFVLGNKIGTDVSGTAALPNLIGGIRLYDAKNNMIGGTAAGAGNLISGNQSSGISLQEEANRNQILGNKIGTDASGASALPNTGPGIFVSPGSFYNHIGGAASGAGNLISGNKGSGVYIRTKNTTVQGNRIGTDLTGTAAIPNQLFGVRIAYGNNNLIGGLNTGEGNLISGNLEAGLVIGQSNRNQVLGNLIGTNAAGTAGIGNGQSGVILKSCNRITVQGNLISGNDGYGIFERGASFTTIDENRIGTNAAGSAALPNTYGGVVLFDSSDNSIGGTHGNLISGNGGPGVLFSGDMASYNTITHNKIGVDLSGNLALGNAGDGITLWNAPNNTVGGLTAGQGNRISANSGVGVQIYGQGSYANLLFDNQIGLSANGAALGNALDGVLITAQAYDNLIGATYPYGRGNSIAHNHRAGVAIAGDAWGNLVAENALFSNHSLGIDLGADGGVEANDILDADIGPNAFQNYPEITGLSNPTTSLGVAGTLHSAANAGFTIDFYASKLCDRSAYGEGQQWLGNGSVNTDGSGVANFYINLGVPRPAGNPFITATVTDDDGNTSEFSACFPEMKIVTMPLLSR